MNICKSVSYLVSSNFGETLAVFINIMTGTPLILLPILPVTGLYKNFRLKKQKQSPAPKRLKA